MQMQVSQKRSEIRNREIRKLSNYGKRKMQVSQNFFRNRKLGNQETLPLWEKRKSSIIDHMWETNNISDMWKGK